MSDVFVRSPYNYDMFEVSKETSLVPVGESMTQESFKDDSDINVIVERFGLTGKVPGDYQAPVSGDFRDTVDFKTAMDSVTAAQAKFMELPGALRYRFANDPQRLMDFLEDGANRDEAIRLGLVQPPPEKTRDVVAAVDELAAKLLVKP